MKEILLRKNVIERVLELGETGIVYCFDGKKPDYKATNLYYDFEIDGLGVGVTLNLYTDYVNYSACLVEINRCKVNGTTPDLVGILATYSFQGEDFDIDVDDGYEIILDDGVRDLLHDAALRLAITNKGYDLNLLEAQ
ncbi:hypothetical protein [Aquitalea pelogenes]|uniref:hypothetical protein n=1 Tax=Aquitalea pelogenes TaxID=1293573 RepID=UPI0035AFC169